MGYDIYITRAESWLDSESFPIPQADWETVVRADPELETSTQDWFERNVGGTVERIYDVIWTAHADRVSFWFFDDAIRTKNPDQSTVEKMVRLAGQLQARVIGEEDEEYGVDGNMLPRCAVCGKTATVHLTDIRNRLLFWRPVKTESHYCRAHIPEKYRNSVRDQL